MSTPETPPQNTTPDASEAVQASESHAPAQPVGPATNGHADATASPEAAPAPASAVAGGASEVAEERERSGDEDGGDEAEGEASADEGEGGEEKAGEAAAAGALAAPGGEKKRRRRRRKKKTGAQVALGDAPPPEAVEGEAGGEEASASTPEEGGESSGEGKGEARGKRRDRKPGPPRERPPVNAGDIVFGKILEITDDAIFIDIPGKAHAIFDRRELLIQEDEEPSPRPGSRASAPAVEAPPGSGSETAAEAPPDPASPDAGDLSDGAALAPPPVEDVASSPGYEGVVPPEAPNPPNEAGPAETAALLAESPRDEEADRGAARGAEPAREPKVPRVVLEVGADFIGVVYNDGARGGLVVLTHHPNRVERSKPLVENAFHEKTLIFGLITGVIKGGIEVDIDGLRAFAPGSHVELRMGTDLSHLVGRRLPFYVTEYSKRGRDVVLSRRAMLEDEAKKTRAEALAKLKIGEEIDGVVRSVVPFGAFIDVGGIEGLVPLQEMSHNRADGPSDVFKAGEPARVRVMKIDDKGKIWLSRKATIADPWQLVAQKYAPGTRHAGKIARLQAFGAFVELEPGIDGLIHLVDLSIKRIEAPEEVVKVGDSIDVVVANVDPYNHKIALHPAPLGDAANEAPQRVVPHKGVKAKVVAIEAGGLVVRILGVTGRNARGYVTAAGTGTPRGTELRKVFSAGQEVDAKVIEMDPRRGEVKLSIKALSEDQERNAYQQYRQQLKAEARFTFGDLLAKKTPSR